MDPVLQNPVGQGLPVQPVDSGVANDIEIQQQPASNQLQSQPPERKANGAQIAWHSLKLAGLVLVSPLFLPLAPFYLLFAGIESIASADSFQEAGKSMRMYMGQVFKPFTHEFHGILGATQGVSAKDVKHAFKAQAKEANFQQKMAAWTAQQPVLYKSELDQAKGAPFDHSADVNSKDTFGLTQLMKAETAAQVDEFLAMGASCAIRDNEQRTALYRFVSMANEQLIVALLEKGQHTKKDYDIAWVHADTMAQYAENQQQMWRRILAKFAERDPEPPVPVQQSNQPPPADPPIV